jgi:hypothetical protein
VLITCCSFICYRIVVVLSRKSRMQFDIFKKKNSECMTYLTYIYCEKVYYALFFLFSIAYKLSAVHFCTFRGLFRCR